MAKEPKEPTGKFIKLSDRVWEALALDAERCRRSVTKQIEAIFLAYYGLDDVDLGDIAAAREAVSPYLAKSDQPAGGKDPRKGRAFLERVLREMDEEEGTGDAKSGDRKTGNG